MPFSNSLTVQTDLLSGPFSSPRVESLAERFFISAERSPEAVALRFFDSAGATWRTMTWAAYAHGVRKVAGWLVSKGISPGDRVAILSLNRPEWMICDLAILAIGAVSVPIYATSTPKDLEFILDQSGTKALFYDVPERLGGVVVPPISAGFFSGDLEAIIASDVAPLNSAAPVLASDLATIVYTSGTTGLPKGVVHTHGTMIAAAGPAVAILNQGSDGHDRFMSFLPLSHVAERLLVEIGSVFMAGEVVFARSADTLIEDMGLFPPTMLLCVPRLWERIYEKITSGVNSAGLIKRLVFKLAVRAGSSRIVGNRIVKANDRLLRAKLADVLMGHKLKKKLGIHRVRSFFTGSAPTPPEVLKFFGAMGVFIREVYGLTENLCLGVYTSAEEIHIGTCGLPFVGNEVRLGEDGEIFVRAPYVFKGYFRNDVATKQVLSEDGWFATGDYGAFDSAGRLGIRGRKKELLKTSTGHYVAPVPIECELKREPAVVDAMVIGDSRKYCAALVVVDEGLATGSALDALLRQRLSLINAGLSKHEHIARIGILKSGFTVANGMLTPTMKLKRSVASKHCAPFIERLYATTEQIIRE